MNTFYAQHRAVARLWAVLTMFAVLLSAFSAPLSAFAEEPTDTDPVVEETTTTDEGTEGDELPLSEGEEFQMQMRGGHQGPPQGHPGQGGKDEVTICHSNNSNENAGKPFTKNKVDEDGLNGHDDHSGDIIPITEDFPLGQNLETMYGDFSGAEILANDCEVPKPKKEVKISITKIVCDDEASLPNDGYSNIDANTATTFLANNQTCSPVKDFKFQWAKDGQSNGSSPDNTGELGSPWVTSVPTDVNGNVVIKLPEKDVKNKTISVREVWSDDYIPFAGSEGGNVSAEIYCANDAANFDNLEWIQNVQGDTTYHCVAWNVEEEPEPVTCELTVTSDEDDLVVEKNAYAKILSTLHINWVPEIASSVAEWIWGDNPVVEPTTESETQTFKKSFTWNGLTVDSAVLTLASDNSHAITLGSFSGGDAGEFNYGATKTYNVAAAIATGTNTLTVEVENFGVTPSDAASNPAGLIYELKIKGTGTTKDCGQVVPLEPEKPKFSDVTMCKYGPEEQKLSGWNLMLLGDKVGSADVSSTNGTGATVALNTGAYVAVASGTWDNNRGPLNIVDAEYSTEDNWATHMDGFTGYGTDILELQLNGVVDPNSNWGAYNDGHEYARAFTQTATGTATFAIYDTYYGDNTGSLDVAVYEGYAGLTGQNGCVTFEDVPYGTYSVDEIMQDGWENVSGLGEVTVDSDTETINVVNRPVDDTPVEKVATVVAHKIVCEDEADLPNWGATEGYSITSTTAVDWVTNPENSSCRFAEDWEFEWAGQSASNPDNNLPTSALYGAAGGEWTMFGTSTDVNGKTTVELTASQIEGMSNIWVREVLKTGYIPFTYGVNNDNNVTAEMYCHTDAFNYDNYDRVDGIAVDNTYYCVAWNHAVEKAPICDPRENLIANGGFEAPEVTDGAGWDIFDATYDALAWVVDWVNGGDSSPAEASLELHRGVNGWTPASGAQHAELDSDWQGPGGSNGENASVMISQTIDTIAGKEYNLSWKFSPRPGTSQYENVLEVLVDGVVKKTNTAAGVGNTVWTADNYVFTGTGAPMTVSFQDAGMGNSEGTFLDDVSLNCSEPENGGGNNDDDTYRIEGYVWNDDDTDEFWQKEGDSTELPLAGWVVKATYGSTTYATTTDAEGYYYFEVSAGTWTISQEVQAGWEQTTNPDVYVVKVPADMTASFFDRVLAYVVPVAHAAVVAVFDENDFGNNYVGTTPNPTTNGGGGGGGGQLKRPTATPTVAGVNTGAGGDLVTPEGQVLGDQVSAVPYGAPGTGHGGTSTPTGFFTLLQFFALGRRNEEVK